MVVKLAKANVPKLTNKKREYGQAIQKATRDSSYVGRTYKNKNCKKFIRELAKSSELS